VNRGTGPAHQTQGRGDREHDHQQRQNHGHRPAKQHEQEHRDGEDRQSGEARCVPHHGSGYVVQDDRLTCDEEMEVGRLVARHQLVERVDGLEVLGARHEPRLRGRLPFIEAEIVVGPGVG
jgi:hypothetical protein